MKSLLVCLFLISQPTEREDPKYIECLQQNRWDWLNGGNLTCENLAKSNTILVVDNLNIYYRREAKPKEKLFVSIEVIGYREESFLISQTIKRCDGKILVDATTLIVCIDSKTRKSKMMPKNLKKFIKDSSSGN